MKIKLPTLVLLVIFASGCTTLKMVMNGKPGIYDDKKSKTSLVAADGDPAFFKIAKIGSPLDTLTVNTTEPYTYGKRVTLRKFLKHTKTQEFVVLHKGSMVYLYKDDRYKNEPVNIFSISKSFISLLTGIALEEGNIKSIDDKVTDYIPELKVNPSFNDLTIKHLLMMTSGLKFSKVTKNMFATLRSDEAKSYYTNDLRKLISEAKKEYPAGQYWVYKNTDVELLSWVLEKATGMSVSKYFENKIWSKIGTNYSAGWAVDAKNVERTHCCFYTTATDLAKLGQLILDNGKYNNQQIIPAAWINKIKNLEVSFTPPPPTNKDRQLLRHQYLWWKPNYPAANDIQANGSLGQYLYIDFDSKTVIVKLSNKNAIGYPYRKIAAALNGKEYKPSFSK